MVSLSQANAVSVIYSRVVSKWTATPFIFDEEDSNLATGNVSWARFTLRHDFSAQSSLGGLGNRRWEREAQLIISIFTLESAGRSASDILVGTARTHFEGVSAAGVVYRNATSDEAGVDGKWYQVNLTIDLSYEEIK